MDNVRSQDRSYLRERRKSSVDWEVAQGSLWGLNIKGIWTWVGHYTGGHLCKNAWSYTN